MTQDVVSNVKNLMPMAGLGHNADGGLEMVQTFKLRRDGQRPFVFKGSELCSAMSYASGTPLWYEINIYQHVNESFPVEVKMFTKAENERDHFHLKVLSSLDGVFEYLENYNTEQDIDVAELALSGKGQAISKLALQAATLKLRMEEAKRQFDDIVGQILFELESAE
jgi:hypothetical protein